MSFDYRKANRARRMVDFLVVTTDNPDDDPEERVGAYLDDHESVSFVTDVDWTNVTVTKRGHTTRRTGVRQR